MGLKTAGVGQFTIPTAPAAGVTVTSGVANVFTTTYVQLSANAPSALFITGIHLEAAAAKAATYIVVQLATGAAGSEGVVGQVLVPLSTASTVALGYRQIYPPIPVANAVRIACKTADSVGGAATLVTIECIAQSNVVDDGVPVGSVAGLTAANLDATVSSRMATYAQPAGFLASTFPTTVASPTNITAGTITTATNLTNLPAIPANWISAAGIAAAALNGKGDWSTYTGADPAGTTTLLGRLTALRAAGLDNLDAAISSRSTYAGTDTAGTTTMLARVTSLRAAALDNVDATVSSRLPSASYTAPDNAGIAAVKAKTDGLVFTVAGQVDAHLRTVNGIAMTGLGTLASPWKAA